MNLQKLISWIKLFILNYIKCLSSSDYLKIAKWAKLPTQHHCISKSMACNFSLMQFFIIGKNLSRNLFLKTWLTPTWASAGYVGRRAFDDVTNSRMGQQQQSDCTNKIILPHSAKMKSFPAHLYFKFKTLFIVNWFNFKNDYLQYDSNRNLFRRLCNRRCLPKTLRHSDDDRRHL